MQSSPIKSAPFSYGSNLFLKNKIMYRTLFPLSTWFPKSTLVIVSESHIPHKIKNYFAKLAFG